MKIIWLNQSLYGDWWNKMKSRLMANEQLLRFMRYRSWWSSSLISQYFTCHVWFPVWLKSTQTGHYLLQLVSHLKHKTRWDSLYLTTCTALIGQLGHMIASYWSLSMGSAMPVWVGTAHQKIQQLLKIIAENFIHAFNLKLPVVIIKSEKQLAVKLIHCI